LGGGWLPGSCRQLKQGLGAAYRLFKRQLLFLIFFFYIFQVVIPNLYY
jgi:hypothetical protein